jgi:tripartite-type tricarboxylate transporter receptor subunit TctC
MVEQGKTQQDRDVLALYASATDLGRAVFAPPDVPADRVKALRAAFMDMLADKDFLAELNKANMDLDPLSGEQLQAVVAKIAGVSPETLARARQVREQTK